MPRRSLEQRIHEVVSEAAQRIAVMVRADLAAEVQRVIAARGLGSRNGHAAPRARKAETARRNLPARCVFPGCTDAHKGPRFSFLCPEHLGIPKAEKRKHLDAWKADHKRISREKRVSPTKATAKGGRRSDRRGSLDEATVTRVLKVIEDHPGLRSEEIYKKLPLPPALAKKALAKLRDGKRVKTTGEKRSMTYASA